MTTTDGARPAQRRTRTATVPPARTSETTRAALVSRWARITTGTPVLVWVITIRLATVFIDYLLILTTALSIIPALGAYLHQQSGASLGTPTANGAIALWLVPFLFVVVMLAVAQIAFMRWLWRTGSTRIAKIKHDRPSRPEHQEPKPSKTEPLR
ncbi:hypothetical protein F1D05_09550 [Kribbella qitaiheensis]|uniref:Uncharacterized protein n=1 Tax=Kribbella qitaiheensis TaxID=1544730 RepID=A0A7G6WVS1_9ACTN|nr:hypothetical protein [Kribbella qitaiheensis]QNE18086.1 hypothetical protein F1D05_09550 [Kribbella qitaiheensis]